MIAVASVIAAALEIAAASAIAAAPEIVGASVIEPDLDQSTTEQVAVTVALAVAQARVAAVSVVAPEVSVERAPVKAAAVVPQAWAAVVAGAAAASVVVVEVAVVVVEVAVAAVVVVAAAVAEGGKEVMKQNNYMTLTRFFAATLFCLLVAATVTPQTAAENKGRSFATAQDAANALIEAAEKYDETALKEILGPESYDIVHTGEPARDREVAQKFAEQARIKTKISLVPRNPHRAILEIGDDSWPFAVPIVKVGPTWSFDTKAGRQELLFRRIGGNELDAIAICRKYVEAQNDFALTKRGTSGVNQYAQRIISTPGTQDGLAWQNSDGTWGGPIGEEVAAAIARGYSSRTEPFHGYFFKILKGQGPAAPLGELDYVIKGVMIGGFALIAFPAQYRLTGVQTFMVSNDGVVYQKDLGPKTTDLAGAIDRFNPDKSWTPVLDQ